MEKQHQHEADTTQGIGEAEVGPATVPIGEMAQHQRAQDGATADETEAAGGYQPTVSQVCDVGYKVSIHEAHGVASYEVAEG